MIRFERPDKPTVGLLEIYSAIGVFALVVARFVPLARWVPGWGCVFRKTLGIPCLTCGMTRAFDWFLQGRWFDSFAVNPLGFCAALLSAMGFLYLVAAPLRPPRVRFALTRREGTLVRAGAVLAVAGNWAYLIARVLWVGA